MPIISQRNMVYNQKLQLRVRVNNNSKIMSVPSNSVDSTFKLIL